MSLLKITLTPAEPYFLGSERCSIFDKDEKNATQRSLVKPYFLRSGQLPAQTALFGVTRYLGIRTPGADMQLTREDKAAIGESSFDLSRGKQCFGDLLGISPLMLVFRGEGEERHLIPAPMHHRVDMSSPEFRPFETYLTADTLDGRRWIPDRTEYSAKDYDPRRFLCLETGLLEEDPFGSHVQVGINLQQERGKSEPSSFFKREMARLRQGYSFTWFARLADGATEGDHGFTAEGSRMVFVGQGSSAFSARWETVDENEVRLPGFCLPDGMEGGQVSEGFRRCFPSAVRRKTAWGQDGEKAGAFYAYAASDLYFPGDPAELRASCMFSMAGLHDQRSFTTAYGTGKNMKERYNKAKELRKTIAAGSVFLFDSRERQQAFRQLLESSALFAHGLTAGFNHIYYSD